MSAKEAQTADLRGKCARLSAEIADLRRQRALLLSALERIEYAMKEESDARK